MQSPIPPPVAVEPALSPTSAAILATWVDGDGRPALAGLTVEKMAQALPLSLHGMERLGDDVLLDYRMVKLAGNH